MLLISKLSDVLECGGNIPLIDLVVKKKYPLQYFRRDSSEKSLANNTTRSLILTEAEETKRALQLDKQKQKLFEQFSEEAESECLPVSVLR